MTQFVIPYDNLLSEEETKSIISYIDSMESTERTTANRFQQFVLDKDNRFQPIFDSIRDKINPILTVDGKKYMIVGYSHMVSIHKQYPGFPVPFHYDGEYTEDGLVNLTKALIYLNNFTGGETNFYTPGIPWASSREERAAGLIYTSAPNRGSGVVFDIRFPHDANPPLDIKYGLGMRLLYKEIS